jgi:Flp pilus assembly protein TadG
MIIIEQIIARSFGMKQGIKNFIKKAEHGQAIILIAFAFVGLVAMVGLVTDTGIVLIEYGKLKRSVDAAAVGAAQQYRQASGTEDINAEALENAAINFLYLNQINNLSNITVHSCEDAVVADRPTLCNPDPVNNPIDNRKLVQVTASANVTLGFLRVIGLQSITLTATSIGEAATIDLVLIMDTSASMAFETGVESNCNATDSSNTCLRSDADDDPSVCNPTNTCEPMASVKEVAIDFIDTLYFPYDRVSVVVMTSQNPGEERYPMEIIPLTSDKNTVVAEINDITVFEPRVCDDTYTEGICLNYVNGGFTGSICDIYEKYLRDGNEANADPSSCPSSNVGGVLALARESLTGSGDPTTQRLDAFWVVVALIGGPANATDVIDSVNFPNGQCPMNTWLLSQGQGPWCRDPYPSVRHSDSDTTSYTNPISGQVFPNISIYDADDYARDMADDLATLTTGNGVTVYTIGLGAQIQNVAKDGNGNVLAGEPPPGEDLLKYIAEEAGGPNINHGQYFYAETVTSLSNIFDRIAQNIATKISQ